MKKNKDKNMQKFEKSMEKLANEKHQSTYLMKFL